MAGSDKVLINLATGMEDGERVLVAFLVATAAQQQGKEVVVWATKDAVRLGLPGELQGVVCKDCPPLERLWEQFTEAGGELWLCPSRPRRDRATRGSGGHARASGRAGARGTLGGGSLVRNRRPQTARGSFVKPVRPGLTRCTSID
jgi:predicted peroxiredoxin